MKLWVAVLALAFTSGAEAQVFKCIENGRSVFSDKPCTPDSKPISVRPASGRGETIAAPASSASVAEKPEAAIADGHSVLARRVTGNDIERADGSAPASERLKSCDARISITAAKEILNDSRTLKEPLEMFSPALVLFQNSEKDEAVFWFYAAQLRTRYQLAFQKGDRGQLLSVMLMTTGTPINNYAFQNVLKFSRTLDRVLEWDKTTPNPFQAMPRSEAIDKQLEQVYAGLRDLKAKLVTDKSNLEATARQAAPEIERAYAQQKNPRCQNGKLDPAYAAQETKNEWERIIDFVQNHKDVIREAGGITDIYPGSSTTKRAEVMPNRYEVSVNGNGGKTIYPIVRVSRSGKDVKFTLECISHLPMGRREAFKDVCSQ